MNRWILTLAGCTLAFGWLATGPAPLGAQEAEMAASSAADAEVALRFADYETRLNAILKIRRLEEQEFVSAVMVKVRAGEIPVPMLESSFLWVIENRPDTAYPFVYFERILRKQGALAGLEIPEFDYGVYSQRVQNRRLN